MSKAVSVCAVGLASGVLAAAAEACSGPGAPETMARNDGIGYAGFCIAALVMIPVVILRTYRKGFTWRALLPLALLGLHPAWFLGTESGDCGSLRAGTARYWVILTGLLVLWELGRLYKTRKAARYVLTWRTWLVSAILAAAAGLVWLLPWTLDPLPYQLMYVKWDGLTETQLAQEDHKKMYGVYAASAKDLARDGRLYGLQVPDFDVGSPDDRAGQEPRQLGHAFRLLHGSAANPQEWRVDGGLTNWAMIARPVGFPERGTWVQYLMLSDGSVWTKTDPGTGKFLVDGVPSDLRRDGWVKDED